MSTAPSHVNVEESIAPGTHNDVLIQDTPAVAVETASTLVDDTPVTTPAEVDAAAETEADSTVIEPLPVEEHKPAPVAVEEEENEPAPVAVEEEENEPAPEAIETVATPSAEEVAEEPAAAGPELTADAVTLQPAETAAPTVPAEEEDVATPDIAQPASADIDADAEPATAAPVTHAADVIASTTEVAESIDTAAVDVSTAEEAELIETAAVEASTTEEPKLTETAVEAALSNGIPEASVVETAEVVEETVVPNGSSDDVAAVEEAEVAVEPKAANGSAFPVVEDGPVAGAADGLTNGDAVVESGARVSDSGSSEGRGPAVSELIATTYATIKTKVVEPPTRPASVSVQQSPTAFSPHDTTNTANVAEILQKGAFAKEPLVDFIPYEDLKTMRLEDGIDVTRKEDYLGDNEFSKVFGLPRDEFSKLPTWKRQQKKKAVLLF